jgi:predicted RNA-binding Zn ribbon-like protein
MDATQLELLLTFLNSRGPGGVRDWLRTPERAVRWLAGHGFAGNDRPSAPVMAALAASARGEPPGVEEVAASRRIRDVLVALIAGDAAEAIDLVTDVRVHVQGARVVLEPRAEGLYALATRALCIAHDAQQDGTWSRLGICRNDRCRWVFQDTSRNRSRAWCDMATCGAQHKMRAYRARHSRGGGAP